MMNKIFLRISIVLIVCPFIWVSTLSLTSIYPSSTLYLNDTSDFTTKMPSQVLTDVSSGSTHLKLSKFSAIDSITESHNNKSDANKPMIDSLTNEVSTETSSSTTSVSPSSHTTLKVKTKSRLNKSQKSSDEATKKMEVLSSAIVSIPTQKQTKTTQTPYQNTHSASSSKENSIIKSDLIILFTNDAEAPTLSEMKLDTHENKMHQEMESEQKLRNGLYRVQLGEITTDEFNSRLNLNGKEEKQETNRFILPSDIPVHRKESKVNIDDFFPLKREDSKSIIEISKENMLKEKSVPYNNEQEKSNFATQTNADLSLSKSDGVVYQNNRKSTRKLDEMISNASSISAAVMKRIKKIDPSTKSKIPNLSRTHDFGMTKFSQLKTNKNLSSSNNENSEFSTTKFYNSKELVSVVNDKKQKFSQKSIHFQDKNSKKDKADSTIYKPNLAVHDPSPTVYQKTLSRLAEKLISLDCDIQNLSADATVWRGNETHELNLPIATLEECPSGADCLPMVISWEASADIQSGDVLIVEIDDKFLVPNDKRNTNDKTAHHNTAAAAVYQVTRLGHEHCDITEGELLDITPLIVDGRKLVTLYDKDLTEGINLLIVVSEFWEQQCVRLRVNVKSDNCGENAECSGKGICFSNASMEGYECECCNGFAGSHCEEIDACTPSPCTNNGICVDLSQGHEGNSYQCLCPYGYTGKNCQSEADPCNPSQCLNGGTCITNTTHFRCECSQGFTGPICQHNLNECDSSPCVHGICVDQEDGFRCFCQPGFSGDLCNFEYNECDSNPCVNQGQCIDHIGTYSCHCTKGYQGKRCHLKIDFCANNPCADGYRCVDHGDDFSCVCPGAGDHNVPDCHEVPRILCTMNPCKNAGTCWTSDESFYCACRPGFTGKLCEDDFVIDMVVSSSELLSDVSESNVIRFGKDTNGSNYNLHHAYIASTIVVISLMFLAFLVTIAHYKTRGHFINYRQLIPFFKRAHKDKNDHTQHWLQGKNSSFFEENHINLKNDLRANERHFTSSAVSSSPLQMNVDNDIYCSVNFEDSQQSLLIQ